MTFETVRALLRLRRTGRDACHTGDGAVERVALERRMAPLHEEQLTWSPLSALTGVIAQRRGRWM
jgi:hypothetical protein